MNTPRRLTVALATAAAVTGAGYTVAQAAGPATSTSPAVSAVAAAPAVDAASASLIHRRGRLLTSAERAQLKATGHTTVVRHTRKHGDVTLTVQVGRIKTVSPRDLTVVSRGGYRQRYVLTPATAVRERGRGVAAASVKPGDRVLVLATTDGTARRIVIRRSASRRTGAAA